MILDNINEIVLERDKNKKYEVLEPSIMLHLSNGNIIEAKYYEEDYDSIYEEWEKQKHEPISFSNCTIFADNIIGMVYNNDL